MTPRPRGGVPLQVTPRHMQMAHAVLARRGFYESTTVDYDDHVGACLLGLAKAAKRWDPLLGASFEAYAYQRMLGEHLDYLRTLDHLTRGERRDVREGNTVPRDSPLAPALAGLDHLPAEERRAVLDERRAMDPGPLIAPVEFVPESLDPADDYERVALASAIDDAADSLTGNEAVVVRLCGLRDWPQEDVGALLGVSASRVTQINASARVKLRRRLEPLLRDAA